MLRAREEERMQRLPAQSAQETTRLPTPATAPEQEADGNDDFHDLPDEEDPPAPAAEQQTQVEAPSAVGREVDRALQRQTQREKENRLRAQSDAELPRRFTDRQANATRITFDEAESSQAQPSQAPSFRLPRSQPTAPVSSGLKRPRADEDDLEPSEDEGFQEDNRASNFTARRNEAPPARRLPVQPEESTSSTARRGLSGPSSTAAPPVQPQRKNPGQSIEPYRAPSVLQASPPRSSAVDTYTQVRQAAKANTRMAAVGRKPQQRSPWSISECNQLISLIEEHGPHYAYLKTADNQEAIENNREPILGNRTAEDLRFKARNMKVDYLK